MVVEESKRQKGRLAKGWTRAENVLLCAGALNGPLSESRRRRNVAPLIAAITDLENINAVSTEIRQLLGIIIIMSSPKPAERLDPLKKVASGTSQRLPPPSLFQGPPSHNASSLSLPQPVPVASGGPRGSSQPPPLQRNRLPHGTESFNGQKPPSLFRSRSQTKGEVDSADAVWQEMQSALSEVELSAMTSEHVFGANHSEALEDLRQKQLKLAQAWARSEADEVVAVSKSGEHERQPSSSKGGNNAGVGKEQVPNTTIGAEEQAAEEDIYNRNLDEETERDIMLARQRREANDRYFDRVNNGVLDVVAKLEEVAQAMRAVEQQSKDVWDDTSSIATTAPTASNPDS